MGNLAEDETVAEATGEKFNNNVADR